MNRQHLSTIRDLLAMWLSAGQDEDDFVYEEALEAVEKELEAEQPLTLADYLEHLTAENWHTLRQLIELEREAIPDKRREEIAYRAYLAAKTITTEN